MRTRRKEAATEGVVVVALAAAVEVLLSEERWEEEIVLKRLERGAKAACGCFNNNVGAAEGLISLRSCA